MRRGKRERKAFEKTHVIQEPCPYKQRYQYIVTYMLRCTDKLSISGLQKVKKQEKIIARDSLPSRAACFSGLCLQIGENQYVCDLLIEWGSNLEA